MTDGDAVDEDAGETATPLGADGPGEALATLVGEAVDADLGALDGAVSVAERGGGQRGDGPTPASRVLDLVGGGGSIVGVVPRIEPSLARGLAGRVDGEIRLVLTGSAGERAAGAAGAPIRSVLADHGVEVSVHAGDSPVGVLLVDERAVVGLFDGDGLAAVLSSDSPTVRRWAAETCRRYFAAAEPA